MTEVLSAPQILTHAASGVALLIDGENISPDHADFFVTQSQRRGRLAVKRVYGNAKLIPRWETTPGFRFIHSGTAKNAADMILTIQAVDLAHTGTIGTFIIASSDGDFSHLAHYLRERHFAVIGMGEVKTPNGFREACTNFIELEAPPAAKSPISSVARPSPVLNKLDQIIHDLISQQGDGNGIKIALFGGKMHSQHKVKISTYPEKTWRNYLTTRPDLYTCDPKGPDASVRLVTKP